MTIFAVLMAHCIHVWCGVWSAITNSHIATHSWTWPVGGHSNRCLLFTRRQNQWSERVFWMTNDHSLAETKNREETNGYYAITLRPLYTAPVTQNSNEKWSGWLWLRFSGFRNGTYSQRCQLKNERKGRPAGPMHKSQFGGSSSNPPSAKYNKKTDPVCSRKSIPIHNSVTRSDRYLRTFCVALMTGTRYKCKNGHLRTNHIICVHAQQQPASSSSSSPLTPHVHTQSSYVK